MLLTLTLLLFTSSLKNTLQDIDRLLPLQDEISARKEARIDSLRNCLAAGPRYEIYDQLFNEYLKWDSDSAYYYGNTKMALAREAADPVLINDAATDLARRHLISGMYHDALAAMKEIDYPAAARAGQLPEIDYVLLNTYRTLVSFTRDGVLLQEYREQEAQYLEACLETLPPSMWEYYNVYTQVLLGSRRYQEAQELVLGKLQEEGLTDEEKANLTYCMGNICKAWGKEDEAILYYAQSVRYDLLQPVRQGSSLRRLAQHCFERGDIKRAYKYILRSHSDATRCDAVIRLHEMAGLIPVIVQAHEKQERYWRIHLSALVLALSLLLGLLFFARRNLRRSNAHLKQANRLKDAYLGEFLAMFAEQMNSLERYRVSLRVAARSNDFNVLLDEIRSDAFVESEWNLLMEKFDKTFLGLFPDFVAQLNALLLPDRQVGQDLPAGALNNQLRCYALIRLGITKSGRIATFLRLASSTVYNFRNTLRASALCPRSDIEQKLATLGE